MTFAELYRAVGEIVSKSESYMVDVQAWNYGELVADTPVHWRVYVTQYGGQQGDSVRAKTPEAVLEMVREKWGAAPANSGVDSVVVDMKAT